MMVTLAYKFHFNEYHNLAAHVLEHFAAGRQNKVTALASKHVVDGSGN